MTWARGRWTSSLFNRILPWITHFGSHVAVIFFIVLVWSITRRFSFFYKLFLVYGILCGIVYGLKFAVGRKRPPYHASAIRKISSGPGEILDPCFPSAHSCFAFMMATLLSHWVPGCRILFFVLAGFIGWTRLYLDLHYPTDVIAGSVLGYGITEILLHLSVFTR